MKKIIFLLLIITLTSCGTFNKTSKIDEKTGLFPAKKNKIVTILKDEVVKRDTLKKLIIVPNDEYSIEMTKNLNYFDKILTFEEFQKDIISKKLDDKIPSVSDRIGLKNAYKHYGPFVILHFSKERKSNNELFAGLSLYDPNKADFIYQSEILVNLMWDGWTDQGTMYPLFNSLIDYLNKQK
ncbi:hypothetical protein [Flavobacterium sp. UBA7663]|uniref:hypothetical protein n=1 Tax=Flavobacterium sp. UBA7663 TaxID=1946557 RepID=UPI0025C114AF|nr:hypothetical protein [Flavobacterium sp. UBA7663]